MLSSTNSRALVLVAIAPLIFAACSSDEGADTSASTNSEAETVVDRNLPGSAGPNGAGGTGATPAATGGSSGEGAGDDLPLAPGTATNAAGGANNPAPQPAAGGAGPVDETPPSEGPAMVPGDTIADGTMTFFVTSAGLGNGGDLGGLSGADEFCTELAVAASPDLARRTWHAYLSTSTANARDRIGAGPWHNQAGVEIASGLAPLHDQAAGGALDATWPPAVLTVPLDEEGNQVPNDVHDILTGSLADGTVAAGLTCNDWSSSATTGQAQVGHSNRNGGNRPPSWTTAHPSGCGASDTNRVAGTVTQGGGRGSFYCFAVITGE